MNISSVKNLALRYADKTIDFANRVSSKAMDTKIANTLMPENPTDIAKLLALISTTTKDAVNCYYYTTQSYNNKRIPEDKRKFVAGIDLSNGILNVITQLTLGLCINKWSDKLYERIFNGGFVPTKEKISDYTDKVNNYLKKSVLTENISCSEADIKSAIKKTNKIAKGGFGVIAVLIVTQIIAKRVIVPFLSTPLAGVFKKQLDKREARKKGENTNVVSEQQQKTNNSVPQQPQQTVKTQNVPPQQQTDNARETFKGFEQFLKK